MELKCKSCGESFSIKDDNFICPKCGADNGAIVLRREEGDYKNRKMNENLALVGYFLVTLFIFGRLGWLDRYFDVFLYAFASFLIITLFKILKIRLCGYKCIEGIVQARRNGVDNTRYYFYVKGLKYKCKGGTLSRDLLAMFGIKNNIVYNEEDPRDNFELVSSLSIKILLLLLLLAVLQFFM